MAQVIETPNGRYDFYDYSPEGVVLGGGPRLVDKRVRSAEPDGFAVLAGEYRTLRAEELRLLVEATRAGDECQKWRNRSDGYMPWPAGMPPEEYRRRDREWIMKKKAASAAAYEAAEAAYRAGKDRRHSRMRELWPRMWGMLDKSVPQYYLRTDDQGDPVMVPLP